MNEEAQVETEVESTETEVPPTPASESVEEVKAERPDWLPQKFESPEQLSVAYGELEKRHYQRTDDLKKTVAEEMQKEAFADVPEVPQDYKVADDLGVEIPEDDVMLNWWKDRSHQLGLSDKEFNGFIKEYHEMAQQSGPDTDAEINALGEYGEKRVERVNEWFKSNMEKENYEVLAQMPITAPLIQALENIMELAGQPGVTIQDSGELKDTLTKDDLKNMMKDPRYHSKNDPVFRQKVKAGFEALARQQNN
tara:strand:+ start:6357 stop:7112 length:756 start_codon:yes stop_codon:yes gene_type:complete